MKNKYKVAIIQDARYLKSNDDTFPIKIRITFTDSGKTIQRYYPTGINLTKAGWHKLNGKNPSELKTIKDSLEEQKARAINVLSIMPVFSPEVFKINFELVFSVLQAIVVKKKETALDVIRKQLSENNKIYAK